MAANLTPQYLKAEEQYRRASDPQEELQWLEVMFRELPKHKASEKMQMDLKTKMSQLRKELGAAKKIPKKVPGNVIPRQGAGTVVLFGGPNSGKSSLLAALTRAQPEIAPYPFTTRQPQPGMMTWEDVTVQLIDTPPITADVLDSGFVNLLRGADLAALVVDLGNDDGIEECQAVVQRFVDGKTRLGRKTCLDEEDVGIAYTQTVVVANKIDAAGAADRLELLHELCPLDLVEYQVSATERTGLEELRHAFYHALDVIRVYSKSPTKKEADFDRPYTVKKGSTLADVAELVHKDLAENLSHARIWGANINPASTIKADYVLADKDIVELHAK
ncbi:MAG: GTPase [Pirellulales bacterium]|nr:GTPase [Pirellulales bacterium]